MVWWYYKLSGDNRGLLDRNPDVYRKIIVCKTTPKGRMYTLFDTYIHFYNFYNPLPDKTFHEIILGDYNQKAHFDLDMPKNVDHQKVLDETVSAIVAVYRDKFTINLSLEKDILVFSSHGTEKYSYHIIIDNYRHQNNLETKYIYDLVCEIVGANSVYIDRAVYNAKQSFRILGSHKDESDRTKIFNYTWTYKNTIVKTVVNEDPEIKDLELLRRSLISETSDTEMLPVLYVPEEKVFMPVTFDSVKLVEILKAYNPIFQIASQNGSLVTLKKEKSWECKMCNKTHDSENPYLTVSSNGMVWFHCRRSGDKELIGKISVTSEVPKETVDTLPPFEGKIFDGLMTQEQILKKMDSLGTSKPVTRNKKLDDVYTDIGTKMFQSMPIKRNVDPEIYMG
jgi:hypothetical protein